LRKIGRKEQAMNKNYWTFGFEGWKKIESLCDHDEAFEDFMNRVRFVNPGAIADETLNSAVKLGELHVWVNFEKTSEFDYLALVDGVEADDLYVFVPSLPELYRLATEVSCLGELIKRARIRASRTR
jgi:hypothetical protein